MDNGDKTDEARKGLVDSIKGKAKEVAGAVTGSDSLVTEGQLEQSQAKERRDASTTATEADAEAKAAADAAQQAQTRAAEDRLDATLGTQAVEQTVHEQRAEQKLAAEEAGQRDAARAQDDAEARARAEVTRVHADERHQVESVAGDYVEGIDEHREANADAADAEAEAELLRQRADAVTSREDLP